MHFSLTVLTHKYDTMTEVLDALEPYDEQKQVKPRIEYTKEEVKQEMKKVREKAKLMTEEELSQHSYYLPFTKPVSRKEFIRQWFGEEMDTKGNAVSTYNQEARWDWYVIGGRWNGYWDNIETPDSQYKDNFRQNTKTVKELLKISQKREISTASIILPSGSWIEPANEEQYLKILKNYPDYQATLIDCHI